MVWKSTRFETRCKQEAVRVSILRYSATNKLAAVISLFVLGTCAGTLRTENCYDTNITRRCYYNSFSKFFLSFYPIFPMSWELVCLVQSRDTVWCKTRFFVQNLEYVFRTYRWLTSHLWVNFIWRYLLVKYTALIFCLSLIIVRIIEPGT